MDIWTRDAASRHTIASVSCCIGLHLAQPTPSQPLYFQSGWRWSVINGTNRPYHAVVVSLSDMSRPAGIGGWVDCAHSKLASWSRLLPIDWEGGWLKLNVEPHWSLDCRVPSPLHSICSIPINRWQCRALTLRSCITINVRSICLGWQSVLTFAEKRQKLVTNTFEYCLTGMILMLSLTAMNDDWLLNGTSGINRLYRAMVFLLFSNMTFNGRGSTENNMNNTHNTLWSDFFRR